MKIKFCLPPKYIPLFFLGFIIVLSSCSSRKNMLFNTGKEKKIPNLPVYVLEKGEDSELLGPYVIQPGDQLFLRNLQNIDLVSGTGSNLQTNPVASLDYKVDDDSLVVLPIIGKIKLVGLTRIAAENKINQLYKGLLLNAPQITLTISNLKVSLLGEFTKQGRFFLEKNQVHLIDMISESGGLTSKANKSRIKIIRGNKANPTVLSVNLEDIRSLSDPRMILRNNDIIYAEPNGLVNKLEQISPAISVISIGLTILSTLILINNFAR